MKIKNLQIIVLLVIFGVSVQTACAQDSTFNEIRQSHIDANVPAEKDFDAFLKRDLEKYFKAEPEKDVSVKYELLRKDAAQSGVALPKFYIWVEVYEKDKLIERGAARIAAVEKKEFHIVQYFDESRLKKDTELISKIFPRTVIEKIEEKLKN